MATYALADLHGHYNVYLAISNFLDPDDIVFFLGDAGDRGPMSWDTIKAVYNDPRFIYLKGNHEDMLVKACEDYLADDQMWDYKSYSLCYNNGGHSTMMEWEMDTERVEWLKKLKELPTWLIYDSPHNGIRFYLSHAGFTPWLDENDEAAEIPEDHSLVWSREHFLDEWNEEEMEDCVIVHGHTPTPHLTDDIGEQWTDGAIGYCSEHKICIDTGGFFTGEFCLLNLDTLESIIFHI